MKKGNIIADSPRELIEMLDDTLSEVYIPLYNGPTLIELLGRLEKAIQRLEEAAKNLENRLPG